MLDKKNNEKIDLIETFKGFFCRKNAGRLMKYAGIFLLFLISGIAYGRSGHRTEITGMAESGSVKAFEDIASETDEDTVLDEEGAGNEAETDGLEPDAGDHGSEIVFVHVCGAVVTPGVYSAPKGSRIYELIEMAGGAAEDGAPDALNQAEIVTDGQKIVIPTRKQSEEEGYAPSGTDAASGSGDTKSRLVNINEADETMLATLPGIGEAKAKDIIRYRDENGKFRAIEDIKLITGIKEGLFNKIKDYISVN